MKLPTSSFLSRTVKAEPKALLLVVLIALLPWWHNRHYLRDLYDYGIVLNASGHLDRGEKPYVDFTTPIQAGFFGMNWLIQRAAGGTYAGLTLGGAGLIVAASLLLTLMLARRWPWWAAVAVAFSVTVASASQHTILWHNALGVFALALAAWAMACAPVLRRDTWPWHTLALAGLFLGGINKLNFQLVAVAVSMAWAVRAGLAGKAGWSRVLATMAAVLLAGLVLPVAAEMAWTGASLRLWLANVVQLAAGSRADLLPAIFSVRFLLHPVHDYYGLLCLPQVGLAGVVISLAALAGCWPGSAVDRAVRWDRWLAPLATGLAALAGAALLATNFEIAWIGWAAWLVLVSSLWLGFAPVGRRAVFVSGVVLPALVVGLGAWWSAWQGQRSQFGYSSARREDYQPAEAIAPVFADLVGLRLPPDLTLSLEIVEQSLPDARAEDSPEVFFAAGLEWLDRYFPRPAEKDKPLWVHWGTSYGPREEVKLKEKLADKYTPLVVYATIGMDGWPPEIRQILDQDFGADLRGPVIRRWVRRDRDYLDLSDSLSAARLGGNVDSRHLHFDRHPLETKLAPDGSWLLATARHEGEVMLDARVFRLQGKVVLNRLPGAGQDTLAADCKVIIHGAVPENALWAKRIVLPAGQDSIVVPFNVDAGGRRLMFWVTRPDGQAGGLLAGYRELEITQIGEAEGGAPQLRNKIMPVTTAAPALGDSLFGPVVWRPHQMVVRGGRVADHGLELPAGAEVWLHTDGMTGEIRGNVTRPGAAGNNPFVRALWYKGGRVQVLQQGLVVAGGKFEFHVWTAEPGGWIGLMVDSGEGLAPASARITSATLAP